MSKTMWGWAVVALGVWALGAGAGAGDFTKPVLDKAIKAQGDPAKQQGQGLTFDSEAKVTANGLNVEFSGSWSVQGHDKVSVNLDTKVNDNPVVLMFVVNGKQTWLKANQAIQGKELPAKDSLNVLTIVRAIRFAQQPAFVQGKGFKLSPLGELQVGDATGVGIKIEQPDQRDVSLFFDKTSGLPLKSDIILQEDGNMEIGYSFLFSDYKETNGVKHFTKVLLMREQKQIMEMHLKNFQGHENLNENLFAKP